jgi:hypothetical protein
MGCWIRIGTACNWNRVLQFAIQRYRSVGRGAHVLQGSGSHLELGRRRKGDTKQAPY